MVISFYGMNVKLFFDSVDVVWVLIILIMIIIIIMFFIVMYIYVYKEDNYFKYKQRINKRVLLISLVLSMVICFFCIKKLEFIFDFEFDFQFLK